MTTVATFRFRRTYIGQVLLIGRCRV